MAATFLIHIELDDDEDDVLWTYRASLRAIRPQIIGAIAEDADRVLAREEGRASEKTAIKEDVAARDRLLARLRRFRELPPRAPSENERKAVDSIMASLDRCPRRRIVDHREREGGFGRPSSVKFERRISNQPMWLRINNFMGNSSHSALMSCKPPKVVLAMAFNHNDLHCG